ncbi:MAG: hypothetical protein ABR909_07380 [Candidatus Bathyarchaeia archaeon]|jgi:hypothetical protein
MVIICVPSPVYANDPAPAITRVQGPAQGTTTGSSPISVTLAQTPQSGDVLIAVMGLELTGSNQPQVGPQITQTGVTWPASHSWTTTSSSGGCSIQVWWGLVNSATASKTITIALPFIQGTGTITCATTDICEYSGLDTAYIQNHYIDQLTDSEGNSAVIDTGKTPTTTYANELWVGGALLNGYSQSSPTNGFLLLDGALNNGISVSYLENIVSSTGQAESGTTGAGVGSWLATLVTFPAAPSITLTPSSGQPGDVITISGSGFAVNSPMTATFDGTSVTLSGTTTTDDTGSFKATFTVPATATPGSYTVNATDNQGTSAPATFVVPMPLVLPESSIGAAGAFIACAAALALWTMMIKRSKKVH